MLNTVIVLILLKRIRQKVRGKSGHRLCSVIRGNKWETWQKMWVCIYSWDRASHSQLDGGCWAQSLQQLDFTKPQPGSQGLPVPEPWFGSSSPGKGRIPAEAEQTLAGSFSQHSLTALSGILPNHNNGTGPEPQRQSTTQVRNLLLGKCGFGAFERIKVGEVLAKQIYRISNLIHRGSGTLLAKDSSFQLKFHPVSSTRFTCCSSSDLRWSWERHLPCAGPNIWSFLINQYGNENFHIFR